MTGILDKVRNVVAGNGSSGVHVEGKLYLSPYLVLSNTY